MSEAGPLLSVVIPTRNRLALLVECIERLAAAGAATLPVEILVADDGSTDGSAAAARETLDGLSLRGEVLSGPATGPAVARNRAIERARGVAVLFIGDDIRVLDGTLEGHIEHHAAHPDNRDALLGLVTPSPPLDSSPFIRWLHTDGVQFGYGSLSDGDLAPPSALWTVNVSVKAALLAEVGGFDESFDDAACEDAELGLRLGREGMRLTYRSTVAAQHYHPTDLEATLDRMRRVGRSYRRLVEVAPEHPAPRAPGLRHRLKASALTAAWRMGPIRTATRKATWRFLCDEMMREAMWEERSDALPRIGRDLARSALRDPAARPAI